MRSLLRALLWIMAVATGVLLWLWTSVAIHYTALPWAPARSALAWSFGIAAPLTLLLLPRRGRTLLVLLGVFLVVLVRFLSIDPSNERDWRPEVGRLADATVEGDRARIVNVRNFEYRSENDFDVRYDDRTYDLARLEATDLIICYWDGNTDVAHTMLSFDFGGDDVLALSVEVRREQGEGWGGLPGAFKQFEIIYVLADERDVVKLRTNFRGEDVHLFRLRLSPQDSRALLEDILGKVHELNARPLYYRTLGHNCTTSLVQHMNRVWPDRVPFHRQLLMNGLLPEYAYERGSIRNDLPLEEVMRQHAISAVARDAGSAADFSRRIRAHLPSSHARSK